MSEIVATIRRVNKRVAEISAASQEQSQSLTQVSGTVAQLEKVTQQNAAMVEQATAASDSLKEQAVTLMHAVGGFKLAEEAQAAQPASTPLRVAPAEAPAKPAAGTPLPRQRPASAGELKLPRKGKDKPGEGWEEF